MRKTARNAVRRVGDLPIALASDLGLVRTENQDRLAVLRFRSQTRSFLLATLCDGMGGMADGALCASLALSSFLVACVRNSETPVQKRLVTSASVANENVYEAFQGKGGATLSAFIVDSSRDMVGINIGDSRIYSVSNGSLEQLTIDDTIAGQFHKPRQIHDDHPIRNDLLQYIGIGSDIEPHLICLPDPSKISILLLTTDGVHFVQHQAMQAVVLNAKEPAVAIQRLAELSKWFGGNDNASSIVAESLSQLVNSSDNRTPSSIEVWDAFGELQILGLDRIQPLETHDRHSQPSQSLEDDNLFVGEKSKKKPRRTKPSGQKQKTKPNKGKKARREKPAARAKSGKGKGDVKPQLKIDFDVGRGGSDDQDP